VSDDHPERRAAYKTLDHIDAHGADRMTELKAEPKRTRVLQLLRDLGSTPDEVASSLAAQDVTGVPDDPRCCPIANYLHDSGIAVTLVCSMEIRAWGELLLVSGEVPEPVAEFIKAFDDFPRDFPGIVDEQWLEENPK
jgi:hypothetical protein